MIEVTVLQHLAKSLDVPVYMEEPAGNKPTSYILLEKTGGGETNYIKTATLAVQSYAPSLYEAAQLNEKVKSAMLYSDFVSRVTLNSDYNFTDPETMRYRYQAVFDLVYMED